MRTTRGKNRRLAFTLTGALLALPVLAGCGGGDGDDDAGGAGTGTGDGGETQTGESTTLRYTWWGSGERNERTQAVIDLFHAANENITVEGAPVGDFNGYWERLTIESTSAGAPCIPQMQSRYMSDYSERNALIPLDEYVEDGSIDVSGVPEAIMDTGRGSDGKLYSVPTGVFLYASFHNESLAEQAGVPAPDNDWTWEEWEEWLRTASESLPEGVYAADLYQATDFSGTFFNYVYSHGETVFGDGALAFDEQLLVDFWTMWDDMRQDGVTTTTEMFGERVGALEEIPISTGVVLWNGQPQNQLTQVATVAEAAGVGDILINKLPNGPAGSGENFGSNGLSISTSCEEDKIDEAVQFIDFFLNDPEAARVYGSTNGAVSVSDLRANQILETTDNPKLVESLELVTTIVEEHDPFGIVFPVGGRAMTDAFSRHATSIFQGQATPEQAAAAFMAEANSALAAAG